MTEPFELNWVSNPKQKPKEYVDLRAQLAKALQSLDINDGQQKNLMNEIIEAVNVYDCFKAAKFETTTKPRLREGLNKLLKATEYLKQASEVLGTSDHNSFTPDLNFLLLIDESTHKDNLESMVKLLSFYGDEVTSDVRSAIVKLGKGYGGGDVGAEKILLENIKITFQQHGLKYALTKDRDAARKSHFIAIAEIVFKALNISQSLETAINKNHEVSIEHQQGLTIFNTKLD